VDDKTNELGRIRESHEADAALREHRQRRTVVVGGAALLVGGGFGTLRGLASVKGDAASGAVGYVAGSAITYALIALVAAVLVSVVLAKARG